MVRCRVPTSPDPCTTDISAPTWHDASIRVEFVSEVSIIHSNSLPASTRLLNSGTYPLSMLYLQTTEGT